MLVSKKHITNYIPQRDPFVMIDTLQSCEELWAETHFKIESQNIFVTNGVFSESGLMENMAQTAAAGGGWYCEKKGLTSGISYLGAVTNFHVRIYPVAGDTIKTRTELVAAMAGFSLIKATINLNDVLVAHAELKVFTSAES